MTQQTKNGNTKRRNDVIFILALLLTVMVAGCLLYFLRGAGDTVTITVDGAPYGTYPLSANTTVEIPTGDEELNRLVIRDGVAYMESATCPDGICAAHRPISRSGESIVCLPHRVVVTVITAEKGEATPDIVV